MDRLAYATICQDFDWRNVIFSDEAVVSSGNYSPPACFILMATDTMNTSWQDFAGWVRLSVACWGWKSYDWAGALERIHGRFTVDTYEQILTNVMIPSA